MVYMGGSVSVSSVSNNHPGLVTIKTFRSWQCGENRGKGARENRERERKGREVENGEGGIQEKRCGAGRCKVQEVKGLEPLFPFILKCMSIGHVTPDNLPRRFLVQHCETWIWNNTKYTPTTYPQTSKKVNRAAKARTIVDLAIRNQPQKINSLFGYSKWTCVEEWTVEKLAFGKDPSEIQETSSLFYYRNEYYKAQQRSICENYSLS